MKNNIYKGLLFLLYFILGGYIWFIADMSSSWKFVSFVILLFSIAPVKKLLKKINQ